MNKVYFSYLFPVVVQSNVFSIVTDSWMKVVNSALSWFLTVRGESKTQKAENLKTQAQIFCLCFLCCRPRRAQLLDFPHHYWDVHDRVMGHPKTTTFHWGEVPKKLIKVRQIRNYFFKPTFLPKNERTNCALLLVDLFSFVFWKKVKRPEIHFKINWPLEDFFRTVGQNNFGNKIPLKIEKKTLFIA